MLERLADLLVWPGRVRPFEVDAAPADVLLQSSLVLRGVGATVARLDLDGGTLEARLAAGGVLHLRALADTDVRSRVTIDVEGRDRGGVARVLARELAQGGGG